MDKIYELRGSLTVTLSGPQAHMHLRDLQNVIAAYENAENKTSSLTASFYQDEVKPKIEKEIKLDPKVKASN